MQLVLHGGVSLDRTIGVTGMDTEVVGVGVGMETGTVGGGGT